MSTIVELVPGEYQEDYVQVTSGSDATDAYNEFQYYKSFMHTYGDIHKQMANERYAILRDQRANWPRAYAFLDEFPEYIVDILGSEKSAFQSKATAFMNQDVEIHRNAGRVSKAQIGVRRNIVKQATLHMAEAAVVGMADAREVELERRDQYKYAKIQTSHAMVGIFDFGGVISSRAIGAGAKGLAQAAGQRANAEAIAAGVKRGRKQDTFNALVKIAGTAVSSYVKEGGSFGGAEPDPFNASFSPNYDF